MSLREQLRNDLAEAMRSGETLRRDTLRMTLSALALVEKEAKHDASDDETLGVIVKAVKTRRESVEAYTAAARPDLAAAEEAEIAILSSYLPAQLSESDIDTLVAEAIAATGATSAKEMGKVMGWLGPKTKGRVDGKVLSGKVTAALAARG
ncbi:MAG: GatB/YqeY domain-containing protein [Candidatus Limnocylindrus sp.]